MKHSCENQDCKRRSGRCWRGQSIPGGRIGLFLMYWVIFAMLCAEESNSDSMESLGWQRNRKPLSLENRKTGTGQTVRKLLPRSEHEMMNKAKKERNLGLGWQNGYDTRGGENIEISYENVVLLALICRTYRNISHILRDCSLCMEGLCRNAAGKTQSHRIEGTHWEVKNLPINICIYWKVFSCK